MFQYNPDINRLIQSVRAEIVFAQALLVDLDEFRRYSFGIKSVLRDLADKARLLPKSEGSRLFKFIRQAITAVQKAERGDEGAAAWLRSALEELNDIEQQRGVA
jgi:hypothetical protein